MRILSAYDVPPPMAYPLETENIPSVEKIMRTIREELKVMPQGKTVPASGRKPASAKPGARSGGLPKRTPGGVEPMSDIGGEAPYREEKAPLLRKAIAQRMTESKLTAPHFYLTVDVEMERLIDLRNTLNAGREQKISFNDLLLKAVAQLLAGPPGVQCVVRRR